MPTTFNALVGTPPDAFASGDFAHPTISRFYSMSLIGRIFVILFGLLAASLVAGAILVGAVLFPALSDFVDGPIDPSIFRTEIFPPSKKSTQNHRGDASLH